MQHTHWREEKCIDFLDKKLEGKGSLRICGRRREDNMRMDLKVI
jgi:hypothetical protein